MPPARCRAPRCRTTKRSPARSLQARSLPSHYLLGKVPEISSLRPNPLTQAQGRAISTVRRRRGPEPEMRAGSGPFTEGGQPCLQWFAKHISGLVCRLWNPDPMTLALGNVGDIREGGVVGPLVGVYELLRSMYRSAYPWTVTTKAETRGAGPGLLSGSSTARMRASMVSGVVEWWWPGWKGRLRRQ